MSGKRSLNQAGNGTPATTEGNDDPFALGHKSARFGGGDRLPTAGTTAEHHQHDATNNLDEANAAGGPKSPNLELQITASRNE